jgi:adenylate cyclase
MREDSPMDFAAAGLLDGLEGEERAARLELLERLAAAGVSLDELRAAVDEDRLVLLPLERALGARYTAEEIAERAGLPVERVISTRRALGLPEPGEGDRVFGEDDIEAFKAVKLFLDAGFPEHSVGDVNRVLGEGMARLAATVAAAFVEAFLRRGDTERDLAVRFAEMADRFTPEVAPLLTAAFNAHLREITRRGMIGRDEMQTGQATGAQEIVVCFADLVGFTALGGQIEAQELGSVAGQLAERAAEVATQPVRLVKTIGDAAMFVSEDAVAMVDAALSLGEAMEAADLPALRAGVASGPALQRAGDWYGHAVNLASRVTGAARPGSVLCTEEVRDAAAEAFAWSFAGRFKLKGLPEPLSLYRARRLDAGGRDAAEEGERSESTGNSDGSAQKRSRPGRARRRASSR